jgi:hypothetical protein
VFLTKNSAIFVPEKKGEQRRLGARSRSTIGGARVANANEAQTERVAGQHKGPGDGAGKAV